MRSRSLASLVVLLVFPLSLVGCREAPIDPAALAGTYSLQQINGANLPVVTGEDIDETVRVTGGTLILSGNSFTEVLEFLRTHRTTGATRTNADTIAGTFTLRGSNITFSSPDPGVGSFTGRVLGNTISYLIGPFELTYSR